MKHEIKYQLLSNPKRERTGIVKDSYAKEEGDSSVFFFGLNEGELVRAVENKEIIDGRFIIHSFKPLQA